MTALDLSNYELTFSDEFNTRSISQTGENTTWRNIRSEWRYDEYSDIGFGRSSFVDPGSGYDPFSVRDGILTITAVPDRTEYGYPGSWESGLITTQGNFSQTYGYFEIRADFSELPGAWGAFWLMPDAPVADPNNAGRWQELDVVEHYGGYPEGVYSHIHTTDAAPNEHWQKYLQVYSELDNPSGFHTFGVEWSESTLDFYVNGEFVGSQVTPSDMHGPMYLIANLATQNNPNNNADIANMPISMKIDYIRAYQQSSTFEDTPAVEESQPAPPPVVSAPAPVAVPAAPATESAINSIGSGSDELVLSISQDAFRGDAKFRILVDGEQIGDVQTAQASRASGESDLLSVRGDWGSDGPGKVTVVFLNDLWGGSADKDRNLYLDGASYNGADIPGVAHALRNTGAYDFDVPTASNVSSSAASFGNGPDELIFAISQDAFRGDAKFRILVDGEQFGDVHTAQASRASGESDLLSVRGDWGSDGPGEATVIFLNDLWGGSADKDRNLYLDGASYNGAEIEDAAYALRNTGAYHFSIYDM